MEITWPMVAKSCGVGTVASPLRTLFKSPETRVTIPMLVTTWSGVNAARVALANKTPERMAMGRNNMMNVRRGDLREDSQGEAGFAEENRGRPWPFYPFTGELYLQLRNSSVVHVRNTHYE